MKLRIFQNELDASEFIEKNYECLLKEWMQIRSEYPNARLYKDSICVQNDVTPKTKEQALSLLNADGDYQVLCHAGTPFEWFVGIMAVLSVGVAVYTYMNMPKVDTNADTSGSGNNSLAQRNNKHRVNEREPDIYGTVKSIPDLVAPLYRMYKDNVQVEECLLCIGRGEFDINPDLIKEGETPISTIEGASLSVYQPGLSLINADPQIKIGEAFTERPIVVKQVSSIDGKQRLIPPNNAVSSYNGISFTENKVTVKGDPQYYEDDFHWQAGGLNGGSWAYDRVEIYANFTDKFDNGEQVIIENAIFGTAPDATISGTTDISQDGILTVATTQDITNPNNYKKIRIISMLINDDVNGSLDLAGEYDVESITKSEAFVYEIQLSSNFTEINPNFSRLTADHVTAMSSVLTRNTDNIDLSGTYTIATVSSNEISLVNPSSVNSDWNRLNELTSQQITDMYSRVVTFKGSAENFIGWYYAGSKDSTGMILNFLAQNGIYEGDRAKQVGIEVQYQRVNNGVGTGEIFKVGQVMQGRANNRNSIGITIKQDLPFKGQFRFRVKRENDNGSSANLIDDVMFESAYSYYETLKLYYPDSTLVRLKRLAIGAGTNASELNMIVTRKLHSYRTGQQSVSKIATSNFADIVCDMAIDPDNGRMQLSEIDVQSLYELSDEIEAYFGTAKACEFNYTFDDKNSSYQEMVFAVAEAVFCTARRENGSHYFSFERDTPNSLLLFNHRNMKPESLAVTESFGITDGYDGLEFKWRDPDDNYAEAVIKLPDELQTNYKTVESTGVTNALQAHFLAYRAWNKLKYGRKVIEFTGYGETDLVTRKDRIAVVDSTVPILCSGEIVAQDNTVLTLDYPVDLDDNLDYIIHLQTIRGGVDVIDIVRQIDEYQIEIARIPIMPLVVSDFAKAATFTITEAIQVDYDAYIIEEKNPSATFESSVTARKYDSRDYLNDKDHINNLI